MLDGLDALVQRRGRVIRKDGHALLREDRAAVDALVDDVDARARLLDAGGELFLDRFPNAVVNVHPSLLPQFPGAHAVEEQLEAGVSESGATVHLVDEGVDSGPVLAQERIAVRADDTPETLHQRIKEIEHRLLPRVVEELCAR